MPKNGHVFRASAVILLATFMQLILFASAASPQTPPCPYDSTNPSIQSARLNFKSLNYRCAELEILDYLKMENLTIEDKADAHVLLAAVYYAMLKNDSEKRNRVIGQFKHAFEAYHEWRGALDISSEDFMAMMEEAKRQVEAETTDKTPVAAAPETPPEETAAATPTMEKTKKPWHKQWWAYALGVGIVAGAVVLVAGGGGGDDGGGGTATTLPDFPDPPSGK